MSYFCIFHMLAAFEGIHNVDTGKREDVDTFITTTTNTLQHSNMHRYIMGQIVLGLAATSLE